MIIIATHAVFLNEKDVYGPPHLISLFLNKKKKDHIFIKHRLWGDGFSKIEYYKKGKLDRVEDVGRSKRMLFLFQYFYEFLLTAKIVLSQTQNCELFVGVDSLNAIAGIIFKLFGKVRKCVYFSADFSLERFKNIVADNAYLWADTIAMHLSDQTWSVSKRIVDYRNQKRLKQSKNKLLPNAPFYGEIKRFPYKEIDKNTLVLVSALNPGIAPFEMLIDIVGEARKKIKEIKLIFIGSGVLQAKLELYVKRKKMNDSIKFLGALSHDDMFKVLTKSGVGIAIYKGANKKHFRYFSDSMKARDYLASGLPVIFSGQSAIKDEIKEKNAGKIVTLKKDEIKSNILSILSSDQQYKELRENALALAKENDPNRLLIEYFNNLNVKLQS